MESNTGTGVLHFIFEPDSEPTKLLYHPKQKPRREGGRAQKDKYLPPSTFTGQLKKSRHLGFGVFKDIWSMIHINPDYTMNIGVSSYIRLKLLRCDKPRPF